MSASTRRRSGRAVAAAAVGVLAAVLSLQLAWRAWAAPKMTIRRIVFDSDLNLSDEQLLEMLDLEGETWATVDEAELEERLEAYPVIRKARAVKVFPDGLKLYVYRRRPLAAALIGGSGPSVPAVFDQDGYVVQVGAGTESLDLPLLTGPRFPEPSLGARLPDGMVAILADLAALKTEDPRMYSLVSELELLPRGEEAFDVKLYMNHADIPILIDRRISPETVRRAVLVLDVLAHEAIGTVDEADMRGGQVVFRRTEES